MDLFAKLSAPTSRRLLDDVVANVPMASAAFDREMRYIAHNARWVAAHGKPDCGEILGKSHYEVFPEIRDQWREIHARCLAGHTERSDLDVFDHDNGLREYLRWLIAPWHDESGAVGGIVIYVENITEQVRTRMRLAERESLIRDLFERAQVGLNLCRLDGLWLESNPAFLQILGYSREEADGRLTYWQVTPRKYDADEARQLEQLRTEKRYGPYEKEFIRRDGSLVPVRLNGFLVERDGQEFIWSFVEDLTEQRALEARLEEERVRAIQVSKLATMGEMAASFAHEINNPLGIVSALAYVLEDALARGDGAQVAEALAGIQSTTQRAAKIVRGLGRFARETHRDLPERSTVAALIDDALVLCRARMDSHGVALTVDVASDAVIEGQLVELAQVLVNLLNNAFDAATQGPDGWIRVSAPRDPTDPFVAIVVEDSGPGVPDDAVDSIFRSFFTTKKAGEGTGLGLSVSRNIVERHGGTLTHERGAPNTRFVVRLPRTSP